MVSCAGNSKVYSMWCKCRGSNREARYRVLRPELTWGVSSSDAAW